jgi:hypothetical protein
MRTFILMLCLATAVFAQQTKAWFDYPPVAFGPVTDVWQLALYSGKQGYSMNEAVGVKLVIRNNATKALRVSVEKSRWTVADFQVVRVPGSEVLNLRPYRNAFEKLERGAGGTVLVEVQPGNSLSLGTVDLQKLFNLTPGTYNITATCRLPPVDSVKGVVMVSSNPITISIVAK